MAAVRKAGDLPLEQLAEDAELQVEPSSDALRLFKVEVLEDGERRLLGLISPNAFRPKTSWHRVGYPSPKPLARSMPCYFWGLSVQRSKYGRNWRPWFQSLWFQSLSFPVRLTRPNNRAPSKLPAPRKLQNSGLWISPSPRRKRSQGNVAPSAGPSAGERGTAASPRGDAGIQEPMERYDFLRYPSRF